MYYQFQPIVHSLQNKKTKKDHKKRTTKKSIPNYFVKILYIALHFYAKLGWLVRVIVFGQKIIFPGLHKSLGLFLGLYIYRSKGGLEDAR
jgi:hypothetical protein